MQLEKKDYRNSGLTKAMNVSKISLNEANILLDEYHYLGGVRTATLAIGNWEGCTVWGVMRSRAWHKKLKDAGFNPLELVRMVGAEGHKWGMSSMLAQSIDFIRKNTEYDSVVTYADPMQQHDGMVYKASNWRRLPQDSQPDGYLWKLDGKIVSRKRFYAELGTSAIDVVREKYGDRLVLELDAPKPRFYFLFSKKRNDDFVKASRKVKTWGASRTKKLERNEPLETC